MNGDVGAGARINVSFQHPARFLEEEPCGWQ
jgi:hypothetical protein